MDEDINLELFGPGSEGENIPSQLLHPFNGEYNAIGNYGKTDQTSVRKKSTDHIVRKQ